MEFYGYLWISYQFSSCIYLPVHFILPILVLSNLPLFIANGLDYGNLWHAKAALQKQLT